MRVRASLIAFAFITLGCSSNIVGIYNTEIGHSTFRTFGLSQSSSIGSTSTDNQSLDSLLLTIISSELLEKGLKKSSIPDLYASYLISIYPSSTESQNINSPYSNYNNMDPYYYNYTTKTYKEGVLIIDIKNDTGKLVWQGSQNFKLKTRSSVNETLPEICRAIISTYKLNPTH